jgi:hypothetical protein
VRAIYAGDGHVRLGDRSLTEVSYTLKAVEELDGRDGTTEFGHPNVYGLVRSATRGALAEHVGSRLTLCPSSGDAPLEFTVSKTLSPTTYLIQGLGHLV